MEEIPLQYHCILHLLFRRMATRVPKLEITQEGDDRGRTAQTATAATSTTSVSSNKDQAGGANGSRDQAGSSVRYGMPGM